jgi:uncharacterized phage protein (TIGR01671 family)
MREIKFRGKRIKNGKWVYGKLCAKYLKPYFRADITIKFDIYISTLGEYTGLKDQFGKEIYSGDIVSWRLNSEHDTFLKGIVKWCDYMAGFAIYKSEEDDNPYETDWYKVVKNGVEVIGNIYDNPRLIK